MSWCKVPTSPLHPHFFTWRAAAATLAGLCWTHAECCDNVCLTMACSKAVLSNFIQLGCTCSHGHGRQSAASACHEHQQLMPCHNKPFSLCALWLACLRGASTACVGPMLLLTMPVGDCMRSQEHCGAHEAAVRDVHEQPLGGSMAGPSRRHCRLLRPQQAIPAGSSF